MTELPKYLKDCAELGATELRRRYPAEANTHRNMLQRAGENGRSVDPEFHEFRRFLAIVGPQPCRRATLDRIDNSDPVYGRGKVRWADKRTQNNNKGDTLTFFYPPTGETYTASRLAKQQKVSQSTIRKRKERGWTDREIVEGRRNSADTGVIRPEALRAPQPRSCRRSTERVSPQERRSAREIMFERDRRDCQHYRETDGVEHCIPDYPELIELFGPINLTEDQYVFGKFARWWKQFKPHVIRHALTPWAQDAISRIEASRPELKAMPEYTSAGPRPMSAAERQELRDAL